MKKILIALLFVTAAGFAAAQNNTYSPSTDVLGAHLNYGRGCAACHAPHSGVYGNGNAKTADPTAGKPRSLGRGCRQLVWQNRSPSGQSEHGNYVEVLPTSMTAGTPDVAGVLMCLSCHDGNYAQGAMMKNKVYETLPATYGTGNAFRPCSETTAPALETTSTITRWA